MGQFVRTSGKWVGAACGSAWTAKGGRNWAHLLLPLVVHHLLDHATGLAVQVAELGVLRLNLAGVHLLVRRHNVRPPLHLVDLFQLDHNLAAVREDPGALVREATLGEVAVNDHGLPLEPHLERLNPNIHNTVTALVPAQSKSSPSANLTLVATIDVRVAGTAPRLTTKRKMWKWSGDRTKREAKPDGKRSVQGGGVRGVQLTEQAARLEAGPGAQCPQASGSTSSSRGCSRCLGSA